MLVLFGFTINAQTEFSAGTVTTVPLSGKYTKTGFGFDFKAVSYPTDAYALRLGVGFISYPSKTVSLLGTAVDATFTTQDSILIDSKVRRQDYRISLEHMYFLNNGYNYDMNFYTIAGVRLVGTNQRYRPEDYDGSIYQIANRQERNGFDIYAQVNLGIGYEIAIDFFDFVYFEVEAGLPTFYLLNSKRVDNMGVILGFNLGFRTNFGY